MSQGKDAKLEGLIKSASCTNTEIVNCGLVPQFFVIYHILKERKNMRKKIQSLLYLRQSDYAGGTVEKLNEDSKYPLFYKGFTYM